MVAQNIRMLDRTVHGIDDARFREPDPHLTDGRNCIRKKRLRGVVVVSCTRCGTKSKLEGSELLKRRPSRCAVNFCGGILVAVLKNSGKPETAEQVEEAFR